MYENCKLFPIISKEIGSYCRCYEWVVGTTVLSRGQIQRTKKESWMTEARFVTSNRKYLMNANPLKCQSCP